jgi:hypothetical protein
MINYVCVSVIFPGVIFSGEDLIYEISVTSDTRLDK